MIEFIICDDNKKILNNVEKIINSYMMKNERKYNVIKFLDYDDKFLELLKNKERFRIYILDVETPSYSGIDIARMIRKNDLSSIIIFLTSHNEVGSILLKEELMFLTFICKFDDYENRLTSALDKSLLIGDSVKAITFKNDSIIYTVKTCDILYIYRDSVDRKSIIVTPSNEYTINKSLSEIFNQLGNSFKYSHRACIVNKDRISKIDKKKNLIIFDTDNTTDMLSNSFIKELM